MPKYVFCVTNDKAITVPLIEELPANSMEAGRRLFEPLFPHWPADEVPIGHVTNGVHMPTWDSAEADDLWTEVCGKDRWLGTMDTLAQNIRRLSDVRLWQFRIAASKSFVEYTRERVSRELAASGASCGTSGMKVLVNGGLNLSELDGWWAEAYTPEVGWALGDGKEHGDDPAWDAAEADALYDILEYKVIPEFYDRDENGIPAVWVSRMRESMAQLTPRFFVSWLAPRAAMSTVRLYLRPARRRIILQD